MNTWIIITYFVFSGSAEFLTTLSTPNLNTQGFSILQSAQGTYNVQAQLKNNTQYPSLFIRLSPDGNLLSHKYVNFISSATFLMSQTNSHSLMVPGYYENRMAVLILSNSFESVNCIQFQVQGHASTMTTIGQNDQYLVGRGNKLLKFSPVSSAYSSYTFYSINIKYIKQVSDDKFILIGDKYLSGDGNYRYKEVTLFALMSSSNMKAKWAAVIDYADYVEIYGVKQTIDGGYIIIGKRYMEVIFIRITSQGHQQIRLTLAPYGDTFHVKAASFISDGSILLTGDLNKNLFIMKLSDEGELIFARYLQVQFSMIGLSIKESRNRKGILVTGYITKSTIRDIFVLELNSQGMSHNSSYPTHKLTVRSKQSSQYFYNTYRGEIKLSRSEIGYYSQVNPDSQIFVISQTSIFKNETQISESEQKIHKSDDNDSEEPQQNKLNSQSTDDTELNIHVKEQDPDEIWVILIAFILYGLIKLIAKCITQYLKPRCQKKCKSCCRRNQDHSINSTQKENQNPGKKYQKFDGRDSISPTRPVHLYEDSFNQSVELMDEKFVIETSKQASEMPKPKPKNHREEFTDQEVIPDSQPIAKSTIKS